MGTEAKWKIEICDRCAGCGWKRIEKRISGSEWEWIRVKCSECRGTGRLTVSTTIKKSAFSDEENNEA